MAISFTACYSSGGGIYDASPPYAVVHDSVRGYDKIVFGGDNYGVFGSLLFGGVSVGDAFSVYRIGVNRMEYKSLGIGAFVVAVISPTQVQLDVDPGQGPFALIR